MEGDLDMNNQSIKNLRPLEDDQEVANKLYVDQKLSALNERLSGLSQKSDQLERYHETFALKSTLSESEERLRTRSGKVQVINFRLLANKVLTLMESSSTGLCHYYSTVNHDKSFVCE